MKSNKNMMSHNTYQLDLFTCDVQYWKLNY